MVKRRLRFRRDLRVADFGADLALSIKSGPACRSDLTTCDALEIRLGHIDKARLCYKQSIEAWSRVRSQEKLRPEEEEELARAQASLSEL